MPAVYAHRRYGYGKFFPPPGTKGSGREASKDKPRALPCTGALRLSADHFERSGFPVPSPRSRTMPRYTRAVAAGVPRGAATFADDDAWHDYQEQWLSVFAPGEQLPPIGDQHRRTRWKAVSRQHKKMTAQLESDGAPIVVASSVAPVASSASALASSAAAASSASVASSSASSAADSSEAVHPITAPTAAPATTQHVASAASSSAATSSEAEPTSGDGSTLEPTAGDVYSCALPAAATQPALAPSSLVHVPSNKWVAEHAPLLSRTRCGAATVVSVV